LLNGCFILCLMEVLYVYTYVCIMYVKKPRGRNCERKSIHVKWLVYIMYYESMCIYICMVYYVCQNTVRKELRKKVDT
jgi:hypothetical protein